MCDKCNLDLVRLNDMKGDPLAFITAVAIDMKHEIRHPNPFLKKLREKANEMSQDGLALRAGLLNDRVHLQRESPVSLGQATGDESGEDYSCCRAAAEQGGVCATWHTDSDTLKRGETLELSGTYLINPDSRKNPQ